MMLRITHRLPRALSSVVLTCCYLFELRCRGQTQMMLRIARRLPRAVVRIATDLPLSSDPDDVAHRTPPFLIAPLHTRIHYRPQSDPDDVAHRTPPSTSRGPYRHRPATPAKPR